MPWTRPAGRRPAGLLQAEGEPEEDQDPAEASCRRSTPRRCAPSRQAAPAKRTRESARRTAPRRCARVVPPRSHAPIYHAGEPGPSARRAHRQSRLRQIGSRPPPARRVFPGNIPDLRSIPMAWPLLAATTCTRERLPRRTVRRSWVCFRFWPSAPPTAAPRAPSHPAPTEAAITKEDRRTSCRP